MKKYKSLKILKKATSVCLVAHISPDGDALSSLYLMKQLLSHFGVQRVDMFAEVLGSIDYCNILFDFRILNPRVSEYDVCIMLDCQNPTRTGKYQFLYDNATTKINIDHHATNTREADINIVENTSSTAELMYKIMREFNCPLTMQDYTNVYGGIITDTDNLTVGEMSAETFSIVADCVAHNIDNKKIYKALLATASLTAMKALAKAIDNISSYDDNKILITHISHEEAKALNARDEDFESIINLIQHSKGCELVAFIKPRNNKYYVSLRAPSGKDVSIVARANGGGGHKGASAFWSDAPIPTIEEKVLNDFRSLL